jgi:hypothetical protein
MSDYAAVEMEQDEEKGFRPEIWLRCHEFGGDSVGKRFSSQTNQGLISLEQMVVVVFIVGIVSVSKLYKTAL